VLQFITPALDVEPLTTFLPVVSKIVYVLSCSKGLSNVKDSTTGLGYNLIEEVMFHYRRNKRTPI